MYFDNCQNPKELYTSIEEIKANPPESLFNGEMRGRVRINSDGYCYYEDPTRPLDWSGVYKDAIDCLLKFRKSNPDLPRLPDAESDASMGLQTIQEWCIEVQKPAETKQNTPPAKCQRIKRIAGWIFKIPHLIYILVIFLAALLTCLYLLGWLKPN